MSNDYKTLKLPQNATEKDIKKAYHKLMLKLHPDKNPARTAAEITEFNQVQQAYNTLINKDNQKKPSLDVEENEDDLFLEEGIELGMAPVQSNGTENRGRQLTTYTRKTRLINISKLISEHHYPLEKLILHCEKSPKLAKAIAGNSGIFNQLTKEQQYELLLICFKHNPSHADVFSNPLLNRILKNLFQPENGSAFVSACIKQPRNVIAFIETDPTMRNYFAKISPQSFIRLVTQQKTFAEILLPISAQSLPVSYALFLNKEHKNALDIYLKHTSADNIKKYNAYKFISENISKEIDKDILASHITILGDEFLELFGPEVWVKAELLGVTLSIQENNKLFYTKKILGYYINTLMKHPSEADSIVTKAAPLLCYLDQKDLLQFIKLIKFKHLFEQKQVIFDIIFPRENPTDNMRGESSISSFIQNDRELCLYLLKSNREDLKAIFTDLELTKKLLSINFSMEEINEFNEFGRTLFNAKIEFSTYISSQEIIQPEKYKELINVTGFYNDLLKLNTNGLNTDIKTDLLQHAITSIKDSKSNEQTEQVDFIRANVASIGMLAKNNSNIRQIILNDKEIFLYQVYMHIGNANPSPTQQSCLSIKQELSEAGSLSNIFSGPYLESLKIISMSPLFDNDETINKRIGAYNRFKSIGAIVKNKHSEDFLYELISESGVSALLLIEMDKMLKSIGQVELSNIVLRRIQKKLKLSIVERRIVSNLLSMSDLTELDLAKCYPEQAASYLINNKDSITDDELTELYKTYGYSILDKMDENGLGVRFRAILLIDEKLNNADKSKLISSNDDQAHEEANLIQRLKEILLNMKGFSKHQQHDEILDIILNLSLVNREYSNDLMKHYNQNALLWMIRSKEMDFAKEILNSWVKDNKIDSESIREVHEEAGNNIKELVADKIIPAVSTIACGDLFVKDLIDNCTTESDRETVLSEFMESGTIEVSVHCAIKFLAKSHNTLESLLSALPSRFPAFDCVCRIHAATKSTNASLHNQCNAWLEKHPGTISEQTASAALTNIHETVFNTQASFEAYLKRYLDNNETNIDIKIESFLTIANDPKFAHIKQNEYLMSVLFEKAGARILYKQEWMEKLKSISSAKADTNWFLTYTSGLIEKKAKSFSEIMHCCPEKEKISLSVLLYEKRHGHSGTLRKDFSAWLKAHLAKEQLRSEKIQCMVDTIQTIETVKDNLAKQSLRHVMTEAFRGIDTTKDRSKFFYETLIHACQKSPASANDNLVLFFDHYIDNPFYCEIDEKITIHAKSILTKLETMKDNNQYSREDRISLSLKYSTLSTALIKIQDIIKNQIVNHVQNPVLMREELGSVSIAIIKELKKEIDSLCDNKYINEHRNPIRHYLKSFLGIILAIPTMGTVLLFSGYKDYFFNTNTFSDARKLKDAVNESIAPLATLKATM